jgi:hypothetical protein
MIIRVGERRVWAAIDVETKERMLGYLGFYE